MRRSSGCRPSSNWGLVSAKGPSRWCILRCTSRPRNRWRSRFVCAFSKRSSSCELLLWWLYRLVGVWCVPPTSCSRVWCVATSVSTFIGSLCWHSVSLRCPVCRHALLCPCFVRTLSTVSRGVPFHLSVFALVFFLEFLVFSRPCSFRSLFFFFFFFVASCRFPYCVCMHVCMCMFICVYVCDLWVAANR
jgi:hypothetical protein